MAQLIDILRVEVGLKNLVARVRVSDEAPLMTSEDLQGTTRVYKLMPHIVEHACLGDASETFKEVMGNTELAHLLEHVTVELLSRSAASAEVSSGRTYPVPGEARTYDVELSCPDDVLVCAALSSAVWVMDWAFGGGEGPRPDVDAIAEGLTGLVQSLGDEPAEAYEREVQEEIDAEVEKRRDELLAQREDELAQRRALAEAAAAVAADQARARAAAESAALESSRAEELSQLPSWAVDPDDPFVRKVREGRGPDFVQREASPEAWQSAQESLGSSDDERSGDAGDVLDSSQAPFVETVDEPGPVTDGGDVEVELPW